MMWNRTWIAAVALSVACTVLSPAAFAADQKAESTKTAKQATKKKEAKKPRGRLPAYYRQVVDDTQREKIYSIQAKYRDDRDRIGKEIKKITADLRKKLAELKAAQDTEVTAILSKEQLAKVESIRAQAAAKRKGSTKSSAKTAAKAG